MADAPVKKQPGQGGAKTNPLKTPTKTGRPSTRKPRPSTQLTNGMKSPGAGTNGSSKGANKVGK